MKAPSPLCLRALRFIAFQPPSSTCFTPRRCYAFQPKKSSPLPPPPPPPPALQAAPTLRSTLNSQPGYRKRLKQDNDEEFAPQPLSRPIGMPNPPQPGENTGLDKRSFEQKRADFGNYNKHLEKRARMTQQISKPYFRDWSNLRFFRGKIFRSNERLFRRDVALWFPNFFGKALAPDATGKSGDRRDGYGGLGRNTCEVMRGKVSVVSFVSCTWAQTQVETFCSEQWNSELQEVLREGAPLAQRVWINYEDNMLRWWLLQAFRGKLRRERTEAEQDRYFMVRRGLDEMMKESMGLLNDKVGYVYLVDQDCRIRWAGSADADASERVSMVKGLRKLIQEARTPEDKRVDTREQLRDAVAEITENSSQAAAA